MLRRLAAGGGGVKRAQSVPFYRTVVVVCAVSLACLQCRNYYFITRAMIAVFCVVLQLFDFYSVAQINQAIFWDGW